MRYLARVPNYQILPLLVYIPLPQKLIHFGVKLKANKLSQWLMNTFLNVAFHT